MSENNVNPEQLVKTVRLSVNRDNVIPTPVDPTLSIPGEAADAYATGQGILHALDGVKVNDKSFVNKLLTLFATDILLNDEQGAQTIYDKLNSIGDRDASEIIFDPDEVITVKDAIDEINAGLEEDFDETEVAELFDEVFGGDE